MCLNIRDAFQEVDYLLISLKVKLTQIDSHVPVESSTVGDVVEQVMTQHSCVGGQRGRLERLVGRLVAALRASTTAAHTRHKTLRSHILPLTNVALNKDASVCATASYDRQCRLWSTENGQCVATLKGHSDVVFDVTFAGKNDLRVWTSPEGTCELALEGHEGPVAVVRPLATSRHHLLTGGMDTSARVWDLHMGENTVTLAGHKGAVVGVGGDRSGELLYTASFDGTVKLWDTRSYICSSTLQGHEGEVNGADLSWCGRYLASWGTDAAALLWDIRRVDQPLHAVRYDAEVLDVVDGAWDSCGRRLVTGSVDRTAQIVNINSLTTSLTLCGHRGEVSKVRVYVGGCLSTQLEQESLRQVKIVDSESGTRRTETAFRQEFFHSGNRHYMVDFIFTGWESFDSFKVRNIGSADILSLKLVPLDFSFDPLDTIESLLGHDREIFSMAVSYSGDVIITGSRDNTCVLWKRITGN
ncbi:dynein assembly factor with WDR repeat domains 1-like [Penaeus chinensis]|uniref:dynein assembly factor with WDR repeat domains 1-like n=1 Tax=Penaeus chinensis TaxID=139456 RepID=UPI001FB7C74C|nr:dynein assembly factor with WDR repeat domains 1-like [Penaeus chinensis]